MRPESVRPKHDGITKRGVELADERQALYYRDHGI